MRKNHRKIKNPSKAKVYRRKLSIRKKISGTTESPRVNITKTNKHLFVQVIDDVTGKTLFSAQTFGKNAVGKAANTESAKLIGGAISEKLKSSNITKAVFDRGGRKYTGVIATVADSIRENGIQL
jgi:large subunit ribosomal protein L18